MLNLDPTTTALVMIDLQRGVTQRQLAPHDAPTVLRNSARLADGLRAAGAAIVHVRVLLNEMKPGPSDKSLRDPNAPPPPPEAMEFMPETAPREGDLVVHKRQWGAFHGTDLDQLLRRRGIQTIVLCGVATNFGVESTARAAFDQGYALLFAQDAMTSASAELHTFATEKLFPFMGRVRSTDELLAALPG